MPKALTKDSERATTGYQIVPEQSNILEEIVRQFFRVFWDIVGPQPSLHATKVGDYKFSYRMEAMGPHRYFTVNVTSQAEANMLSERKMRSLVKNEGALEGSARCA